MKRADGETDYQWEDKDRKMEKPEAPKKEVESDTKKEDQMVKVMERKSDSYCVPKLGDASNFLLILSPTPHYPPPPGAVKKEVEEGARGAKENRYPRNTGSFIFRYSSCGGSFSFWIQKLL